MHKVDTVGTDAFVESSGFIDTVKWDRSTKLLGRLMAVLHRAGKLDRFRASLSTEDMIFTYSLDDELEVRGGEEAIDIFVERLESLYP